jgi:hypothetical protein
MVLARLVLLKKTEFFSTYVPPKGIALATRDPVSGAKGIEPDHVLALFIAPERTVYPNQRYSIAKLEKELKDNRCFTIVDLKPSVTLWPDDINSIVLNHEEEIPYEDPRLPQEWKDELDPSRIYEKWIDSEAIDNLNAMYEELGLDIIVPIEVASEHDKETNKPKYYYKIKYCILPDLVTSKNW